MGKLVDLFNQQLKQDKRSQVITKLNGLVNFIIRNLDMSKYRLVIYYHTTNKTTHVEIWDFSISEYAQAPRLVFEHYPGFKRSVVLPKEYLK